MALPVLPVISQFSICKTPKIVLNIRSIYICTGTTGQYLVMCGVLGMQQLETSGEHCESCVQGAVCLGFDRAATCNLRRAIRNACKPQEGLICMRSVRPLSSLCWNIRLLPGSCIAQVHNRVRCGMLRGRRSSVCKPAARSTQNKQITDRANSEGNGPQHSEQRGRRGSQKPPQPKQHQRHAPFLERAACTDSVMELNVRAA